MKKRQRRASRVERVFARLPSLSGRLYQFDQVSSHAFSSFPLKDWYTIDPAPTIPRYLGLV